MNRLTERIKNWGHTLWMPAISLLLALTASGIIMAVCGYNPFEAFSAILAGSFGSTRALTQTLVQATPLIFTGLAFVIAKKATLINIGIEGQLQMGAVAAAAVGVIDIGLPGPIHLIVSILAGVLAGGLYAGIVGFMKVKFGSNEVIATIMLNTIALNICSYLVNYPLKAEGSLAQTERVLDTAKLPRLLSGYQLSGAILLAVVVCFAIRFFFERTVAGYEMKCVGLNIRAAETAGISAKKVMFFAMVLSGAVAGLAGSTHVLGVDSRFIEGFSPGFGYDGIAVAALSADSPVGVIFAGIIFGALRAGCMVLNRTTKIPTDFVNVIQALVILFVAAPLLIREFKKLFGSRKEVVS